MFVRLRASAVPRRPHDIRAPDPPVVNHLLALSFDNLGEAADLQRGRWPADRPLGRHPSVLDALPWVLARLAALDLHATFCIEASNCELYPEALAAIARAGHELAIHGWRHEPWHEIAPEREAALLRRSRAAFAGLGLEPAGFRPPGGELAPAGTRVLAECGFRWVSPAAGTPPAAPLAGLPFRWPLVDAYHALASFAERRARDGERRDALAPTQVADRLVAELDACAGAAETVLVLHPFLAVEPDGRAAMDRVLEHVGTLRDAGRLRAMPVQGVIDSRGRR